MKSSLVDTDILSQFLRGNPKVFQSFDNYISKFGTINISIITYYEILNGLLYKDAKKQLNRFLEFIELNNVIPLTVSSSKIAADQYAKLRKTGKEIGHTDTLIAGIAIANKMQLITNNKAHFSRIKNLTTDNWMK
jgi:predicted nucleic acid-binding protein